MRQFLGRGKELLRRGLRGLQQGRFQRRRDQRLEVAPADLVKARADEDDDDAESGQSFLSCVLRGMAVLGSASEMPLG